MLPTPCALSGSPTPIPRGIGAYLAYLVAMSFVFRNMKSLFALFIAVLFQNKVQSFFQNSVEVIREFVRHLRIVLEHQRDGPLRE